MSCKKKLWIYKLISVMLHIELVIKLSAGYIAIDLHSTGDENWYYFINVFVGNPPQKQSLILDSGSSQISFTCITCLNCGIHNHPPFDIKKSVTGKNCNKKLLGNEKCKYFHRFSEGSVISGNYFSDILRFGHSYEKSGVLSGHFKIKYDYLGCNELETNKIYNQNANGVFGIGLKSIMDDNFNIINSLISSIKRTINIESSNNIVVSICLLHSGGKITIGEFNKIISEENLNFLENKFNYLYWVPIIYPSNIYKVKFEGISVESERFIFFGEKKPLYAIIDVGSTLSFLPTKLYNKVISEFSKLCKILNLFSVDQCITINQSLCLADPIKVQTLFPIIKIKLGGQESLIDWIHTSYLIKRERAWCIGINEDPSANDRIILGISFLKNRKIILDPKKKRIGFSSSIVVKCNSRQDQPK